MNNNTSAVTKEEANQTAQPGPVGVVAPVVEMPIQHASPRKGKMRASRKAASKTVTKTDRKASKVSAKRIHRVTDEQNAVYCESLLTGDFSKGLPFANPLGTIDFTPEQKSAQREAKRQHRLSLSTQEAKSAVITPMVQDKNQVLLAIRQDKRAGTVARFRNFVNHANPFAKQRAIMA